MSMEPSAPNQISPHDSESRFKLFVSRGLNLSLALAAMPPLAAYFAEQPAPGTHPKATVLFAGMACGVVFLAMFYNRERLLSIRWTILGVAACLAGVGGHVAMAHDAARDWDSLMKVLLYVACFLLVSAGFAAVLLSGYVRYQERPSGLALLAAKLDTRLWNQLTDLGDSLAAAQGAGALLGVPPETCGHISQAVEHVTVRATKQLLAVKVGKLEVNEELGKAILGSLSGKGGAPWRIVTDEATSRWNRDKVPAVIAFMKRHSSAVEMTIVVPADDPWEPKQREAVKSVMKAGAAVRVVHLESLPSDLATEALDFVLVGDRALARWSPMTAHFGSLSLDRATVQDSAERYTRICANAMPIPGKAVGDASLIEDETELMACLAR